MTTKTNNDGSTSSEGPRRDMELKIENRALTGILANLRRDSVKKATESGQIDDPAATADALVANARTMVEDPNLARQRRPIILELGTMMSRWDLAMLHGSMRVQEKYYAPDEGILDIESYVKVTRTLVERFSESVFDAENNASFGEVFTPTWVVNQMLDELPEDVWSNPDLKWLDPCCGVGTYMAQVVGRLMEGLESWQANPVERYKHIVENMIYQVDIQARSLLMNMYVLEPAEWLDLNVYLGSFLEEEFMQYSRDVWGVDKFDIVIGNPPYNTPGDAGSSTPLYDKFIMRGHDIVNDGGYVSMINPSRWTMGGKGLNKFRKWALTSKDLLRLKHFEGEYAVFPSVKIRGGVSYTLFKKGAASETMSYTYAKPGDGVLEDDWIEETVEVSSSNYDIFPLDHKAHGIIDAVLAEKLSAPYVSSRKPFLITTNYFNKK